MPLVEDTKVPKGGDVTFLNECGESTSDIVSLIPDQRDLCIAPESATPCELLDCWLGWCSDTVGLGAELGENAGVPDTADDGLPNGEEDGSSGFAFV